MMGHGEPLALAALLMLLVAPVALVLLEFLELSMFTTVDEASWERTCLAEWSPLSPRVAGPRHDLTGDWHTTWLACLRCDDAAALGVEGPSPNAPLEGDARAEVIGGLPAKP